MEILVVDLSTAQCSNDNIKLITFTYLIYGFLFMFKHQLILILFKIIVITKVT
jgi:hypothetical protein